MATESASAIDSDRLIPLVSVVLSVNDIDSDRLIPLVSVVLSVSDRVSDKQTPSQIKLVGSFSALYNVWR